MLLLEHRIFLVIALLPLGIFAIILLCSSIYVIHVLVMEMITSSKCYSV